MADQSNAVTMMQPPRNGSVASMRERSTEELTQAIHSPGDEAFAMRRADDCFKQCRFIPDMSGESYAKVLAAFGRLLRKEPRWAVSQAFDQHEEETDARPTPAGILKKAQAAKIPLLRELKEREKAAEPVEARPVPDRALADRICAEHGFTPKRFGLVRQRPMARNATELYDDAGDRKAPHWTETADPDGPAMTALREARNANKLVQEARAIAAKKEETE